MKILLESLSFLGGMLIAFIVWWILLVVCLLLPVLVAEQYEREEGNLQRLEDRFYLKGKL